MKSRNLLHIQAITGEGIEVAIGRGCLHRLQSDDRKSRAEAGTGVLGQGYWDRGAGTWELTFIAGAGTGVSDLGKVGGLGHLQCPATTTCRGIGRRSSYCLEGAGAAIELGPGLR